MPICQKCLQKKMAGWNNLRDLNIKESKKKIIVLHEYMDTRFGGKKVAIKNKSIITLTTHE